MMMTTMNLESNNKSNDYDDSNNRTREVSALGEYDDDVSVGLEKHRAKI
jgi:hypothetical protein